MSIENNLKRIADSLEIIAGVLDDKAVQSFAAGVPMPECQDVVPAPAEVPAPAPVAEVPAPVVQMTLDQLNTSLSLDIPLMNVGP